MPSIECDNGKWKWGEYGECKYTTKEEAEKDNEDYYEDKASEETEKDMKKDEKRHVKEIIEDDKTITIVYEKDEKFEGIKVKESDTPDEGPTEDVDDEYDDEESHRFTSNIRIIMGAIEGGQQQPMHIPPVSILPGIGEVRVQVEKPFYNPGEMVQGKAYFLIGTP